MKILVSGSNGFIGSALVPFLSSNGHDVRRLVRSSGRAPEGQPIWDPQGGKIDPGGLEGFDGVVHLAGENIATGRWNAAKKARIRDSRVDGTRLLCEAVARLAQPPKILICASAIGYYGDRRDELLSEQSAPGSGFLATVCREWEAATEAAARKQIRVVNLRIGVVLSPSGGALSRMLTPFRMGVGGKIGSGQQYMSWIAIDDIVGAILHALVHENLSGPINAVSPNAVTNLEFTRALGSVLRRPTVFPMPAMAARIAFGEMADALLLSSTRVEPKRLLASGYTFRHPTLEGALRHLLGKSASSSAA